MTLLRLFLVMFLPTSAVVGLLLYGFLKVSVDQQFAELSIREAGQVEVASSILSQNVSDVASDLRLLARTPYFRRYIDSGSDFDRSRVTELFVAMSEERTGYDQIRYIDANGMEVLRIDPIDGQSVVIPDSELQNKSDRYYFRETARLAPGQVYVSPLDLNIEQDQVEIPFKPMMRFGTPVFGGDGEAKGVLVINLHGGKLLEDFRRAMGADHHAMLLNSNGDWLDSSEPERNWGFMFGNPNAFARAYPTAWQSIASSAAGSVADAAGLFTFDTVYPLSAGQRETSGSSSPQPAGDDALVAPDYFWKVVSLVPAAETPAISISHQRLAAASYALLLIALAVLLGNLARALISRRQLREAVFDNELRLREITSTLGQGVVVLNADGIITYANPEVERLLGWSPQEIVGKHSHSLLHYRRDDGTPLPESECGIYQTRRTGRIYRDTDEVFWRKDGSKLPAGVSATPIVRDGRIMGAVVAFQDVTELRQSQNEMRQVAYYDPLTGLPNRRLLQERLRHALAQAQRYQRSLAILFLDLDNFKTVNDTLGHDAGDELLTAVAERLLSCVRKSDTVSRQGGDEFVILLSEVTQPANAVQVADKILEALRTPVIARDTPLQVTCSIGIAIHPVGGQDDAAELLRKADIAMYEA